MKNAYLVKNKDGKSPKVAVIQRNLLGVTLIEEGSKYTHDSYNTEEMFVDIVRDMYSQGYRIVTGRSQVERINLILNIV